MGLSKLREWVGTVTGKGDRWGRDKLGRSAPAFLAASTTALPPPTCTARREASRHCLRLLLFAARPANCGRCLFEACAGRRIRWLCLPAVPCSAGCVPVHPLPAMPTALINALAPVQVCLPPFICFVCPCSFHVRQDRRSRKLLTVLLAAATRAGSGGPCAGSFLTLTFFLQSPLILGHGLV